MRVIDLCYILVMLIIGVAIGFFILNDINNCATDNFIYLGDKVTTTKEYNEFFNDSFSGRVVMTQHTNYIVKDIYGNERVFEKEWLIKVNGS